VKNSYYGAIDKVLIGNRYLPFDIDAISRCLRLLQEGLTLSLVGHLRDEDLIDIFESNAKTTTSYAIAKAKRMWKAWLSYINQRIMLPLTKEHISKEGVSIAMMAWNGLPLNP
jgi:hypothetical protein